MSDTNNIPTGTYSMEEVNEAIITQLKVESVLRSSHPFMEFVALFMLAKGIPGGHYVLEERVNYTKVKRE